MPLPDPRDTKITNWVRDHRDPDEPRFDADAAWSRFELEHRTKGFLRDRRSTAAAWKIAAALTFIAAGAAYYQLRRDAFPLLEKVVANGERATITLDDSTRITLKGGSRLRYTAKATNHGRDVYLEGAALFEVRHDPNRTFRVHAGHGMIQDIGTRFVVSAYPNQPKMEVVVTEGSVALTGDSSATALELHAGDVAMLGPNGVPFKMLSSAIDRYTGWTTGALVLESMPLRDAANELEHWFGIKVIVADTALAQRSVFARFRLEQPDQILDAITLALGARFEKQGSTYTIRPRAKR